VDQKKEKKIPPTGKGIRGGRQSELMLNHPGLSEGGGKKKTPIHTKGGEQKAQHSPTANTAGKGIDKPLQIRTSLHEDLLLPGRGYEDNSLRSLGQKDGKEPS